MSGQLVYAAPEDVGVSEIPVIDLAPFIKGSAADRGAVAAAIADACKRVGFFYVINHGVPESLRQRVLGQGRSFFSQPFDVKMQCAPILDGQWCGYVPPRGATEGSEPGASLVGPQKTVSGGTLEQFNMMRVLGADDPNFDSTDPIYQRNRWPAGLPEFVETMLINQHALMRLGDSLMQALSLALGLPENYLSEHHAHPLATFGLNFYPAPASSAPGDDVGVGTHCDASTFTVLLQDDVGGLEIRDAAGRWIAAPYLPGSYVINIGDTLMGWSNGHFVSTPHRVVSRKPVDRYSATMFMNPDRETTVAPLQRFVSAENPARFQPFLNDDYMRRFYVRFYDQMFKPAPG